MQIWNPKLLPVFIPLLKSRFVLHFSRDSCSRSTTPTVKRGSPPNPFYFTTSFDVLLIISAIVIYMSMDLCWFVVDYFLLLILIIVTRNFEIEVFEFVYLCKSQNKALGCVRLWVDEQRNNHILRY